MLQQQGSQPVQKWSSSTSCIAVHNWLVHNWHNLHSKVWHAQSSGSNLSTDVAYNRTGGLKTRPSGPLSQCQDGTGMGRADPLTGYPFPSVWRVWWITPPRWKSASNLDELGPVSGNWGESYPYMETISLKHQFLRATSTWIVLPGLAGIWSAIEFRLTMRKHLSGPILGRFRYFMIL
jgi:hypothetical protein